MALRLASAADSRELRNAFGAYPTGVTVATCLTKEGTTVGVTANSFVSLSLAPPLVSFAIHVAARHLNAFLGSPSFTINVLRSDQRALSNLFARPSECSWEAVRHSVEPTGHIVLEDVVAIFLCRLVADHPAGDHRLLIGEIQEFSYEANMAPIAFCRGRYGEFRPAAHALQAEEPGPWPDPLASMVWG